MTWRARIFCVGLLAVVACAGGSRAAEASTVGFTSLAAWSAAVGPFQTEDFNGFVADVSIVPGPVALNGMTVSGTAGTNGATTQKIDALPNEFGGFYGTGSTNLLGDLGIGNVLRFDFATALTAFAFDTIGIADGGIRPTTIAAFNSSNVLLGSVVASSDASNQEAQFYGLQFTGGDQAAYITLTNGAVSNDVFSIDNIRFAPAAAPVPEPASLILLGSGLVSAGIRRYRRRA